MTKVITTTTHTVGEGPGLSTNIITTEIVDQLYLHISNSGITVETLEKTSTGHSEGYEGDLTHLNGDHNVHKSWDLNYRLSAFGISVDSNFSLHSANQCDALIGVLTNIKNRMIEHYGEEGASEYDSLEKYDPSIIDGFKVRDKYEDPFVELVNDKYIHIISNLIGYDLLNDEGDVVLFEPRTGRERVKIVSFKAKPGLLEEYQSKSPEELMAIIEEQDKNGYGDSCEDDDEMNNYDSDEDTGANQVVDENMKRFTKKKE